MSKFFMFAIAFLLIVAIIAGYTTYSHTQIDYSDSIFFYDYPNALYSGKRIMNKLSDVTYIGQKIYKVADTLLGISNWSKDAYDSSGHEVETINLNADTKCRYIYKIAVDANGVSVKKAMVWIGTGKGSNSYVIYNDIDGFDLSFGRRIECVYGQGVWHSTLVNINFYDETNQDYLYDDDGKIKGVYVLTNYRFSEEVTIGDAQEALNITIIDHGGGVGNF